MVLRSCTGVMASNPPPRAAVVAVFDAIVDERKYPIALPLYEMPPPVAEMLPDTVLILV